MVQPEEHIARAVFDAQSTGLVVLDRDRRVVAWNAWMESASGISAHEAVGRPLEALFPDASFRLLASAAAEALEAGTPRLLTHTLHPRLLPLKTGAGSTLIHDVLVQPLAPRASMQCLLQITDVTVAVGREKVLRERQDARYHAVVGSAPDAILTLDADGRIQSANPAAAREFGYEPHELVGQPIGFLLLEQEVWDSKWRDILNGDVVRRAIEVVARRKDGSTSYLEVSASRWMSNARVLVTAILRDVNERRAAEAALRESQRQLNAVLDNATVGVILLDQGQRCSYMNAAAEKLTGYTLAEAQGRIMHDLVHHTRPDGSHYPLEECPIDRAFPEDHQMQGEEIFVHKDGSFYPVGFTASPVHDDESRTIGTILEVRDISAEKRAQEHQRLLINELNHRVKNTLATVQSIATQTLRNAASPHDARLALEQRLMALSRTHDVLTRESWEGAEVHDIVAQAVEPYSSRGENRLHLDGPKVRLPPRRALALAMALQELATNAVKYGALSNATGEVAIGWTVDAAAQPARLHLCWEESGGPPVRPPAHRGFGSRLIERSLAQDLDGAVRIDFAPQGLVCTVDAPLA